MAASATTLLAEASGAIATTSYTTSAMSVAPTSGHVLTAAFMVRVATGAPLTGEFTLTGQSLTWALVPNAENFGDTYGGDALVIFQATSAGTDGALTLAYSGGGNIEHVSLEIVGWASAGEVTKNAVHSAIGTTADPAHMSISYATAWAAGSAGYAIFAQLAGGYGVDATRASWTDRGTIQESGFSAFNRQSRITGTDTAGSIEWAAGADGVGEWAGTIIEIPAAASASDAPPPDQGSTRGATRGALRGAA